MKGKYGTQIRTDMLVARTLIAPLSEPAIGIRGPRPNTFVFRHSRSHYSTGLPCPKCSQIKPLCVCRPLELVCNILQRKLGSNCSLLSSAVSDPLIQTLMLVAGKDYPRTSSTDTHQTRRSQTSSVAPFLLHKNSLPDLG